MRRSFLSLTALALAFASALTACAAQPGDDAELTGTSEAKLVALSPARKAALKAEIRRIAAANIERSDNFAEVRAELNPLIDELAASFGERPATENLAKVKGAWRQIWSDFPYPMRGPVEMDPRQVYQVVTDAGYYYNLGDNKAVGFLPLTGVLRGAYEPQGTKLAIRFTRVAFRFGYLGAKRDLYDLATDIEERREYALGIPGGGNAPNGPVGISGTLRSLYVDEDLRIDLGTQDDFRDASGAVAVPGVAGGIFVLDRVTTKVK